METWQSVLLALLGLAVAAVVFFTVYSASLKAINRRLRERHLEAEKQLVEAREQGDFLVKKALREAKGLATNESRDVERVQKEKSLELKKMEERIQKREESLEKKLKSIEQKEQEFENQEKEFAQKTLRAQEQLQRAEKVLSESQNKLETIAQLSVEEAREQLRQSLEDEVRRSLEVETRAIEEESRKQADETARSVVATAIQRMANEFVTDVTISVIPLPSDDMKGRLIGREGRNIRAIEQATGVDLIIDDTPEVVIISCFHPVRREIARMSIERLVADGRVHPARIEEIVQKARLEFESTLAEVGERAAFDCGITDLHPDLMLALGKLKYLSTGGQSLLQHSLEVSHIAGVMAAELGFDAVMARRVGLLHDLGKTVDENVTGHHAKVGAQFLERLGEKPEIVDIVARHHAEHAQNVHPLVVLVQAADTLSHARPGARRDFVEKSITRLRDLEESVKNFEGIEQAFVMRAGREVRALVAPSQVEDASLPWLARRVVKRLRAESSLSGPVKVTLIREQRVTQIAK